MKVFLTGATGYVGRQVARDLLKAGYQIRALVRKGSEKKMSVSGERVEAVNGDVTDAVSFRGKLAGCEAVIHLPAIIREFPKKDITFQKVIVRGTSNVVDAAKENGVQRFIHMSALGTSKHAKTEYFKAKFAAEEYVMQSGLAWTVLQPSVISGHEDEGLKNFVSVLMDSSRVLPLFVSVIGTGQYRFQPVALDNVSEAIVKCLVMPQTIGRTYQVAGTEQFTYNQMLDIIAEAIGKKKTKLHLPIFLMRFLASLLGNFSFFPFSRDQLADLLNENICTNGEEKRFFEEFLIKPISFRDGIREQFSD